MTTIVLAVSGAAGATTSSPLRESAEDSPPRVTAPERCPRTIAAVRFYSRRIAYWAELRSGVRSNQPAALTTCPRYLAHLLQRKARAARRAYELWHREQYEWWLWLPDKFRRVGHCETGNTPGASAAGNWSWDSGTYVSAFGIIRAAFPSWNGHNTPREQYEVAASIQRRYGWSAWGCGGA